MSTAEHYDVIVIGRTVAGLITAALMAKRRFRVRVLDAPKPQTRPQPFIGLETTPSLYPVMEELGLVHDIRTRLYGVPAPISIALTDRRFDIPSDPAARGRILGEVFPDSVDAVLDLFQSIETIGPRLDQVLTHNAQIPLDGSKAERATSRYLSSGPCADLLDTQVEWSNDPAVRGLATALLAVMSSGCESPQKPTVSTLRSLWHAVHGVARFRGGTQGFSELIAKKLLSVGGTIEERRTVSHLDVRRNTVKTVVTSDGGQFSTEAVVLDGGDAILSQLWNPLPPPESTVREMRVQLPMGHCPEALHNPCGWVMTEHGPACSVKRADDELWIEWPASASTPDLESLIPFHGGQISDVQSEITIGSKRIDGLGLFQTGPRSRLKNLVYVGNTVLPHQGLESECWTASMVADLLTEALSKRWRLSARI